MPIQTIPFDAAEHLGSEEAQAELLADALESRDSDYIANAQNIVRRARAMSVAETSEKSPISKPDGWSG